MRTGRVEAFSDGVLAIIITIMVLELKTPTAPTLSALATSAVGLLTYLLSFVYVGIYWNNHHHMFHLVGRVTGWVLWANLHLLFWLSLIPFTTAWMDDTAFAALPVAVYGVDLMFCAVAWFILQRLLFAAEGDRSVLRRAVGRDVKGKLSPVLYVAGILATLLSPWLSLALYSAVAVMWLVPDRRFERAVEAAEQASPGS